jgi:para-aminobenzoate synthetase component 1
MNYMSCRLAARWAKEHAADESIILNPDQTVSETNTANLLCVISGNVCRPYSDHVLPGIMEKAVCRLLASWGRSVNSRPLSVGELKNAEAVFLTNSLMGAVSVDRIDGHPITNCEDLCHRINDALRS